MSIPATLLLLVACGDDDAAASDGAGGATSASGAGGESATSGTPSGAGGDATTGGSAGGGGSPEDPLARAPLAAGVRLEGVTALQTTSVPLVVAGAQATSEVPLVAGRDVWFRASLAVDADGPPVRLEVLVQQSPDGPVEVFQSAEVAAVDAVENDLSTTPVCQVPAAAISTGARWAARLVSAGAPEVDAGTAHDARFPRDGVLTELGADLAPPLRITLVPFRWDGDGTGRLPDTSPAALDVLRGLFVARFPVADVEITVHAAVPYDRGLDFFGDVDFNDVNDLLYDLREAEAPPPDAHYYGMLAPADSFDDYCNGTCTTGQSYVADFPEDAELRVGAGVAFDPESAAATAVHEVGHMFGRYHAPCDVSSWDEDYPYDDGAIGVLGWDPRLAAALDPVLTTDFMGYCDPQGTSDYTFTALFDRLEEVAALPMASRAAAPRRARPTPITCKH